jgi:DNA mismatch endonuclease (patch repair protein)
MMSGIRAKDTKPEQLIRRGLHAKGLRFRLHARDLPGKPDLVFPKFRAAIFVHGCFWHCHACHLFKWPSTREDFWKGKFAKNRQADARALELLSAADWRTAVIWECALKGKTRLPLDAVLSSCAAWLECGESQLEIAGEAR